MHEWDKKGWSKCQIVCITRKIKTNVTEEINLFLMLLLNTNISSDTVCVCAPWTKRWCLLSHRSRGELWWSFKEWSKLILHSSISSAGICYCHFGLSKGISSYGDMWKVQCIIAGDLLEQHDTPIQMQVGCVGQSWNWGVKLYSGIIQHFGKLSYFHHYCSHMSRNVLFNYQCLLFWDLKGGDGSCSENKMEVFHNAVNVQVTTCTVFWSCSIMCLMSFQFGRR